MSVVALLAAIGAVVLLVKPSVPAPVPADGGAPDPVSRRIAIVGAVAAVGGVVLVGRGPQVVALAVIALGAALATSRLVGARSARRGAAATGARVLEACDALSAELTAGRPPGIALDRVADDWPVLVPVAEAFRVGADVPAAWRAVAATPGAGDLTVVAAAWQVAHRTGEGLADTLAHVARDLRGAHATRRVVEGELASARATARLVALLPVLALSMGSGAGGDPWGFLLTQPVGLACLALGLAFAFVGLAWIEALARGVERP